MMGATHGLAGVLAGALLTAGVRQTGAELDAVDVAVVITTATIAAELPDLDLKTSRISHGSSTLTAIPVLRLLALPLTLPLIIAGAAIRATGATHRGPTHSPAAALLWALAIVPLYALYLLGAGAALAALTGIAGAPTGVAARLDALAHQAAAAWTAAGALPAIALLAGYTSHLLLDAMTKETQQLAWPLNTRGYTLPAPTIRVGGPGETLLVAIPLALAVLALAWTHTEHLTADFSRSLPAVPAPPQLEGKPELGLPSIAMPAPTQLP